MQSFKSNVNNPQLTTQCIFTIHNCNKDRNSQSFILIDINYDFKSLAKSVMSLRTLWISQIKSFHIASREISTPRYKTESDTIDCLNPRYSFVNRFQTFPLSHILSKPIISNRTPSTMNRSYRTLGTLEQITSKSNPWKVFF